MQSGNSKRKIVIIVVKIEAYCVKYSRDGEMAPLMLQADACVPLLRHTRHHVSTWKRINEKVFDRKQTNGKVKTFCQH